MIETFMGGLRIPWRVDTGLTGIALIVEADHLEFRGRAHYALFPPRVLSREDIRQVTASKPGSMTPFWPVEIAHDRQTWTFRSAGPPDSLLNRLHNFGYPVELALQEWMGLTTRREAILNWARRIVIAFRDCGDLTLQSGRAPEAQEEHLGLGMASDLSQTVGTVEIAVVGVEAPPNASGVQHSGVKRSRSAAATDIHLRRPKREGPGRDRWDPRPHAGAAARDGPGVEGIGRVGTAGGDCGQECADGQVRSGERSWAPDTDRRPE